jgi:hypothetical protein
MKGKFKMNKQIKRIAAGLALLTCPHTSTMASNINDTLPVDHRIQIFSYCVKPTTLSSITETCHQWHTIVRANVKPFPAYSDLMIVDPGKGMPPEHVKKIHINDMSRFYELVPHCPFNAVSVENVTIPTKSLLKKPRTLSPQDNATEQAIQSREAILTLWDNMGLPSEPIFLKTLAQCTSLKSLNLRNCKIGVDNSPFHEEGESITFSGTLSSPVEVDQETMGSIYRAFLNAPSSLCWSLLYTGDDTCLSLTELDLSDNALNPAGSNLEFTFHSLLVTNTSLTRLNIANTGIHIIHNMIPFLPNGMSPWDNIVELDLSGNVLSAGVNAVSTIIDAVQYAPSLKKLTLLNVDLSDEDKKELKDKLSTRLDKLELEEKKD